MRRNASSDGFTSCSSAGALTRAGEDAAGRAAVPDSEPEGRELCEDRIDLDMAALCIVVEERVR
jgi:hypothetical protein